MNSVIPIHEDDTISIFIRDCKVDLRVGVFESEMQKTQAVLVNVVMEAGLPYHFRDMSERTLNRIINYGPLYKFISHELATMGHIYLLESYAEKILDYCFRDERVRKVTVRMEKTEIFPSAAGAGVEITRMRPVKP